MPKRNAKGKGKGKITGEKITPIDTPGTASLPSDSATEKVAESKGKTVEQSIDQVVTSSTTPMPSGSATIESTQLAPKKLK